MLDIPDQPEVYQDIVFNVQAITGRVIDKQSGVKGSSCGALREGKLVGRVAADMTTTADGWSFHMDAIVGDLPCDRARDAAAEAYPVAVVRTSPTQDLELSLGESGSCGGASSIPRVRASVAR
jgi:hypothetical protein